MHGRLDRAAHGGVTIAAPDVNVDNVPARKLLYVDDALQVIRCRGRTYEITRYL